MERNFIRNFVNSVSEDLVSLGAKAIKEKIVIAGVTYNTDKLIRDLKNVISNKKSIFIWEDSGVLSVQDKRDLIRKVYAYLHKEQRAKTEAKMISTEIAKEEFPWGNYKLMKDIKTGEDFFVSNNRIAKDINYDTWSSQIPKSDRELALIPQVALKEYDPYTLCGWGYTDAYDFKCVKINTYVPPMWRLEPKPEEAGCPEIIERVLEHLFPKPECREFVLDWLYTAMMEKNETFLVLNGAKGIGKGVFCSLGKLLVGREHYSEVPESLVTSQFNSVLLNHRLLVLDEYKVDKVAHTKLKRFINDYVNVEKKGVDASHAQQTYNSYIISNNDEDSQYIEWDDRRFSVIDLNTENLTTAITESEINELARMIDEEDMELAKQWGNFILDRGADNSKFTCWKGDTFWKLVYVSLKNWQKHLVDKILYGGEEMIDLGQLRKSYKREEKGTFPNRDKVADFLKNYRHNGSADPLGEVVCEDGEFFVSVAVSEDLGDFL